MFFVCRYCDKEITLSKLFVSQNQPRIIFNQLADKILQLIKDNPGLVVRNKTPFVDSVFDATLLECRVHGGHVNRYRPLTQEEIPESIRPLISSSPEQRSPSVQQPLVS